MTSLTKKKQWQEITGKLLITTPKLFKFQANLGYLRRTDNEVMYQVSADSITRTIPCPSGQLVVKIMGTAQDDLICQILNQEYEVSLADKKAVVAYLFDWFDLNRNLQPFYDLAQTDPLLAGPVQTFEGMRVMGIPDFFEAISWGIIGQQINLAFAYTLKRNLVETYGEALTVAGQTYWVFPTAKRIAELELSQLMKLQLSRRKAEYLKDIAQKIARGDISKKAYQSFATVQGAEKALTQLRGIGPWTANYVLMRCLRYPDALPVADVGLLNVIKHLNKMTEKPTESELMVISERWQGWQSYATFYLWRVLY